uniref:amino acid ABC transporter ATP-binding protein n=1 Tax=Castellaniella defragrans TaxID=75697 RepID=UPI0033415236
MNTTRPLHDDGKPDFVRIRNLHKSYTPALKVLDGLDLGMSETDRVVVIGPSGGGKSTLLRCMMGLEKIEQGEIRIDGQCYIQPGPAPNRPNRIDAAIQREVGMVFQHYTLFPHLSVMGNLTLAPVKERGVPRAQASRQAMELLTRFGLADKARAYPNQLSGGQMQRVAIARALMLKPRLMLFDEVTSALDPELVREVEQVMMHLAEQKMPMMIVTHDMWFARNIATQVIFCAGGRIVEQGPPQDIFSHPREQKTREFLENILHVASHP